MIQETMEELGRRVSALVKSGNDKLISAGRCLAEARERWDAGEDKDTCPTWKLWVSKRTNLKWAQANVVLRIGRAPDPEVEAEDHRARGRVRQARSAAKRKSVSDRPTKASDHDPTDGLDDTSQSSTRERTAAFTKQLVKSLLETVRSLTSTQRKMFFAALREEFKGY